jgi:hypothetical protein
MLAAHDIILKLLLAATVPVEAMLVSRQCMAQVRHTLGQGKGRGCTHQKE